MLRLNQGLGEHANYHEFCRLLSRLKTNYQLSELVAVEGYQRWIQSVAEFTLTSLQSWQWASSSVYYLLCLWSRLISSVPYLKARTFILSNSFQNTYFCLFCLFTHPVITVSPASLTCFVPHYHGMIF